MSKKLYKALNLEYANYFTNRKIPPHITTIPPLSVLSYKQLSPNQQELARNEFPHIHTQYEQYIAENQFETDCMKILVNLDKYTLPSIKTCLINFIEDHIYEDPDIIRQYCDPNLVEDYTNMSKWKFKQLSLEKRWEIMKTQVIPKMNRNDIALFIRVNRIKHLFTPYYYKMF